MNRLKCLPHGLTFACLILVSCSLIAKNSQTPTYSYKITDTGFEKYFDNKGEIPKPKKGQAFYGQDAHYQGFGLSYKDNGDGTVTDRITDLMWEKAPSKRMLWSDVADHVKNCDTGGYTDWGLPSLKELLSLAVFSGDVRKAIPYIDTNYFIFEYPVDEEYYRNPLADDPDGNRMIDAQYISNNEYVGTIMRGNEGVFGFNFADGHIKCYPKYRGRHGPPKFYVRLVRGNSDYGKNIFADNGDGTITDLATGLMWQKADDGVGRNWEDALSYAENLELAGYNDWYLPDVKELHSIVDYTRNDPAINPIFVTTDKSGWYWTSTSYLDRGELAIYIAFGKAVDFRGMDTHGAGATRGDFKSGDPSNFSHGLGPQRDEIRINNYVRCVRKVHEKR